MIKRRRYVVGMLLVLAWAGRCPAATPVPGQQFEGFDLAGYEDNGQKKWDVRGETADVDGDLIRITNVDANQYGAQDMNLTAKSGTINKANGNILLERDVVITSGQGGQVKTDSLNWDKEQDLVSTDDAVEMTDGGIAASGQGLRASPGLKTAQLNQDVTVTVQPQPQEQGTQQPIVITSEGPMELDQLAGTAVLRDQVVAVQGDRTLRADQIEVFMDTQTQAIERMVCSGHVEIRQGENVSYSDQAVYDARTQKLNLTGRPKLILMTGSEAGLSSLKK